MATPLVCARQRASQFSWRPYTPGQTDDLSTMLLLQKFNLKKHPQVQHRRFPAIKLYAKDLRELASIFSNAHAEVQIQVDNYELDDVSELASITQARVQYFRIRAKDGSAFVSLGPASVELLVSGDSLEDRDLVASFEQFFSTHRQRLLDGRYTEILCDVVLGLASLGLWILFVTRYAYFTLAGRISIWLCASALPCLTMVTHRVRVPHSLLFTRDKADTPSFWSRNRDKILIDFIKVLVGAIVGGVAVYFLGGK